MACFVILGVTLPSKARFGSLQADNIMTAPRIDNDILEDVIKRGFDRDAVIDSLRSRVQNKVGVGRIKNPLNFL